MNTVILVGRCGEYLNSLDFGEGNKIITFGLATVKKIKKNDVWVNQDVWHKIILHNTAVNFAINGLCQNNNIISIKGTLNYYDVEENGIKYKKAKIDVYQNRDIELIAKATPFVKNELGPKNIVENPEVDNNTETDNKKAIIEKND